MTSDQERKRVTSHPLSTKAVVMCWILALTLIATGVTATFLSKPGTATAVILVLGGLLVLIALMKRIPLRFAVAGSMYDAGYDEAYEAGRATGMMEGRSKGAYGWAGRAAGKSPEIEDSPQLPRESVPAAEDDADVSQKAQKDRVLDEEGVKAVPSARVYSIVDASRVVETTRMQMDYWTKSGLVPMSATVRGRPGFTASDLVWLRIATELFRQGFSIQKVRSLMVDLRDRGEDRAFRSFVVGDSDDVFVVDNWDQARGVIKSGRGGVSVDIGQIYEQMMDKLNNRA